MKLALVDRRTAQTAGPEDLDRLWGPGSAVHGVVADLGRTAWAANLVLVSDRAMADLNRDFRRQEGVTDVLSFPYLALAGEGQALLAAGERGAACDLWPAEPLLQTEAGEELLIGEVVLAPAYVREECRRAGRAVEAEFLLLTIHGCLHLLGWDHAEPGQRRRMQAQEGLLLGRLGLVHPLLEGS